MSYYLLPFSLINFCYSETKITYLLFYVKLSKKKSSINIEFG